MRELALRDITHLARGKRGIASTALLGKKRVLIKQRNPLSTVDTIAHEAMMLERVNDHGLGPRLIALEPHRLVREYVVGEPIADWTRHSGAAAIRRMLIELFDQGRTLDRIGINKAEMTRPLKHVLVRRGVPMQIDYDRARLSRKPQNVTQLCQFVTAGGYAFLLRSRGVAVDKDALLSAAKTYKNTYANKDYLRLRALVGGDQCGP